jgi:hypothetical protein
MKNPAIAKAALTAAKAQLELAATLAQAGRKNEARQRAKAAFQNGIEAIKSGASSDEVAPLLAQATKVQTECTK